MADRLIELADRYFAEYLAKIERATEALDYGQLWWRANERSNSIANLLLHLRGNLSQWVLAGLLDEAFERRRSAEFAARAGAGRNELVAALGEVVGRCRAGIVRLAREDLERPRRIQGYEIDGYAALFHALEHMSYHTGQIVMLAKQLAPPAIEIEFYPQHRGE
ncbi:MAG TPA: DinB family protein [Thermoanaerobaculia bacterium]|nr:DinB family protein [Thermoanaerobaculia bacterium]